MCMNSQEREWCSLTTVLAVVVFKIVFLQGPNQINNDASFRNLIDATVEIFSRSNGRNCNWRSATVQRMFSAKTAAVIKHSSEKEYAVFWNTMHKIITCNIWLFLQRKRYLRLYAVSEDWKQPARPHSLIWAYKKSTKVCYGPSYHGKLSSDNEWWIFDLRTWQKVHIPLHGWQFYHLRDNISSHCCYILSGR